MSALHIACLLHIAILFSNRLNLKFRTMSMQDFLFSLRQNHDADNMVFVRDDHASARTTSKRSEKRRRSSTLKRATAPPTYPLRKVSFENLTELSKMSQVARSDKDLICSFFDEVAPGLHTRTQEKKKNAWNTNTPRQADLGNIFDTSPIFETSQITDYEQSRAEKEQEIAGEMKKLFDEVQGVAGGSKDAVAENPLPVAPQESRWTARTA